MKASSRRRDEPRRTGRLASRLIVLLVVAITVPTLTATTLSLTTWRSAYRRAVLERQHELAELAAHRGEHLLDVVIEQIELAAMLADLSSPRHLEQIANQLFKANWCASSSR